MNQPFGRAAACERSAQAISQQLDDELSELELARLRTHLDGCDACRLLEQDLAGVTHELRLAPLVAPTRSFVTPRLRAARVRSLRPLVASAAVLLVVVGSVGSLMRAGLQPRDGISSLNFQSPVDQIQFATLEHKRIEQKKGSVKLKVLKPYLGSYLPYENQHAAF
jgi:anti-sigma factor RsiW